MKLLFILSFTLVGWSLQGQQSIDGNWTGTRETPNGKFEVSYTFKSEGNVLTGTWKTQFGESALQNGKIEDKKISYTISFNDRTINYTGEILNENEIQLKNEMGEMKLTRVKQ